MTTRFIIINEQRFNVNLIRSYNDTKDGLFIDFDFDEYSPETTRGTYYLIQDCTAASIDKAIVSGEIIATVQKG